MTSFQDILNVPLDDSSFDPPRELPAGTYVAMVAGPPEVGPLGSKGTPAAKFDLTLARALPDVDPTALAACLKGGALSNRKITYTMWLTDASKYRVKQFLNRDLGIETAGKNLTQLFSETPGKEFLAVIKHKARTDGKGIRADVEETYHISQADKAAA